MQVERDTQVIMEVAPDFNLTKIRAGEIYDQELFSAGQLHMLSHLWEMETAQIRNESGRTLKVVKFVEPR